ncbi:hypothetical protein LV89_03263 [Arcicella aurantiaca]|uniref:Uncharacterized protein n=1 Tax=Arcicella aurantiaca TaxID=591202 RepID=A0A316DYJ4_9BACT|nr:hypothetical protein [Arcicella aurantiaca]PWK22995.1 hypothetical protein LV89_03263 [Arcicella aurantiaca]
MENSTEENLDQKKKELEIVKLEREITKLECEGTELKWRKYSNWGPAIIAIFSVAIVGFNGYLTDSKSKLVAEETKNQQVKNDKSRDIFRRDSLILIAQKNKIQRQLDSLGQKFIDDKQKFDKERAKYGYVISKKEIEIGALKNEKTLLSSEISKVENCFPKAKEFLLEYCVKTNVKGLSYDSLINQITPPPYKTRFNRPLEEIAKLDISKMNYSEFLQRTANFKLRDDTFKVNAVSEDGSINIVVYAIRGNLTVRQAPQMIANIKSKFECYKDLSISQKLKLLNEVIVRKN